VSDIKNAVGKWPTYSAPMKPTAPDKAAAAARVVDRMALNDRDRAELMAMLFGEPR
jgi:hypothetical protein